MFTIKSPTLEPFPPPSCSAEVASCGSSPSSIFYFFLCFLSFTFTYITFYPTFLLFRPSTPVLSPLVRIPFPGCAGTVPRPSVPPLPFQEVYISVHSTDIDTSHYPSTSYFYYNPRVVQLTRVTREVCRVLSLYKLHLTFSVVLVFPSGRYVLPHLALGYSSTRVAKASRRATPHLLLVLIFDFTRSKAVFSHLSSESATSGAEYFGVPLFSSCL